MLAPPYHHRSPRVSERGNMLFMILIAVVLIGILTAVIMRAGNTENSNIDKETLVLRVSEAQRAASEFERAVMFILSNNRSETEIRFAHPAAHADYGDYTVDPERQVFHPQGGGATYREPPADINDGISKWEFYGSTAVPGAGSNRADLIAVLPNVTQPFCDRINALNGQPTPPPADTGDCLNTGASWRFNNVNNTNLFDPTPNTMSAATFAQDPNTAAPHAALQACVRCDDASNNYYYVLLAR